MVNAWVVLSIPTATESATVEGINLTNGSPVPTLSVILIFGLVLFFVIVMVVPSNVADASPSSVFAVPVAVTK